MAMIICRWYSNPTRMMRFFFQPTKMIYDLVLRKNPHQDPFKLLAHRWRVRAPQQRRISTQCRCLTSHFPWFFWRCSSWIFPVVNPPEIGNLLGSSCFFLASLSQLLNKIQKQIHSSWLKSVDIPIFHYFSGQNPNFQHFLGKKPQHFDLVRPCCAVAHGSADLELVLPMHCKAGGWGWLV